MQINLLQEATDTPVPHPLKDGMSQTHTHTEEASEPD